MANNNQNQSAGMPSPVNQANQAARQRGSGFTNLSKILNANINNRLASTVSSGIQGTASGVRQGTAQARTDFAQKSQGAADDLERNKQIAQNVLSSISQGQTGINEQQQQGFNKATSGIYSGPKEIDQQKQIELGQRAQDIQRQGQALGSSEGRQGLLQNYVGGPQYTSGQQRLDLLLLGKGQPQDQQALAKARASTKGLSQEVQQAIDAASQIAQTRQGQAEQAKTDVLGQQEGIKTNIISGLEDLRDQFSGEQAQKYDALINRVKQGNVTNEDLQLLGVQGQQATYGAEKAIPELLSKSAINLGTVADPTQKAQLAALAQLLGKDVTEYVGAEGYDPNAQKYDPTKALGFDTNRFGQLISEGQQKFNTAVANRDVGSSIGGVFQPIADEGATSLYGYNQVNQFPDLRGKNLQSVKSAIDQYDQGLNALRDRVNKGVLTMQGYKRESDTKEANLRNALAAAQANVDRARQAYSQQEVGLRNEFGANTTLQAPTTDPGQQTSSFLKNLGIRR